MGESITFETFPLAVLGFVEWIRQSGGLGIVVFAVAFVLMTLIFVPASPLTALAGFLYGPLWGTLLVSPIGVAAAALAFFFGRTIARPWMRRYLAGRPRLAAVDRAVAQGGFRVVLLLRLASIIPFAPLSYGLGATRISARDFVSASWLGLLPGTFLYAYLGSLAPDIGQILGGELASDRATRWLTGLGLAVALLALALIGRYARQAVNQSIQKLGHP